MKKLLSVVFILMFFLPFNTISYGKANKAEKKEMKSHKKNYKKNFFNERYDREHHNFYDRYRHYRHDDDDNDRYYRYYDRYDNDDCSPGRNGIGHAYGLCKVRDDYYNYPYPYKNWEDMNGIERADIIAEEAADFINSIR